jgi:hypothetical protein
MGKNMILCVYLCTIGFFGIAGFIGICNGGNSIKEDIENIIDNDHISLSAMDKQKKENILYYYGDSNTMLSDIDDSLNKGYRILLEDIEKNKYPCFKKTDIKKYRNSDISTRTIGYENWVNGIKGALKLREANELKYQIIIMTMLDDNSLLPKIKEKEKELERILTEISEDISKALD